MEDEGKLSDLFQLEYDRGICKLYSPKSCTCPDGTTVQPEINNDGLVQHVIDASWEPIPELYFIMVVGRTEMAHVNGLCSSGKVPISCRCSRSFSWLGEEVSEIFPPFKAPQLAKCDPVSCECPVKI